MSAVAGAEGLRRTQIVPKALGRYLGSSDRAAAGRAMQAMFKMCKIDIATLDAACRGE